MELKDVKILLQKFFDAQTSEEEERQLADYFSNEEVPEELEVYKQFFDATNEISQSRFDGFEDEVMSHILENEHREKSKYRWMWQTVTSVAAVLIVALLLVNYNQEKRWQDTYEDPEIAYQEATKALQYMAGKYQKGMAQLQPVAKLEKASAPLHTGLNLVNKGFEEMSELKKMNQKQKTE